MIVSELPPLDPESLPQAVSPTPIATAAVAAAKNRLKRILVLSPSVESLTHLLTLRPPPAPAGRRGGGRRPSGPRRNRSALAQPRRRSPSPAGTACGSGRR